MDVHLQAEYRVIFYIYIIETWYSLSISVLIIKHDLNI